MDHLSLKIPSVNHRQSHITGSDPSSTSTDATMKKHSHLHLHHPHLPHHHHKHNKHKHTSHPSQSSAFGGDSRSGRDGASTQPDWNGDRRRSSGGDCLSPDGSLRIDDAAARAKEPDVSERDLMKLEQRRRIREETLACSISELKDLSDTTSRRLDELYYSIRDRFTKLDSTVSSIQELSRSTSQLRRELEIEAGQMQTDVRGQIDDSDSFEPQRAKITGLAERLKEGGERLDHLQSRITNIRRKIAEWEKSELEWRLKTRRRLRLLWGVITFGILLFVAVTVFQYLPSENNESVFIPPPSHLAEFVGPGMIMQGSSNAATKGATASDFILTRDQVSIEDDPRLRLFDEL